jgi:hypothetical protein
MHEAPDADGSSREVGYEPDDVAWFHWWLTPKHLVFGLVGVFLVCQLVPVWLLQTNPSARSEPRRDSARTETLVHRACFDCHSNSTTWPWYGRIAPVSWLTTYDVVAARNRLNFDEWKTGSLSPGDAAGEVSQAVLGGDMPPSYYLWMHPGAALSAAEKQELAAGLANSLH